MTLSLIDYFVRSKNVKQRFDKPTDVPIRHSPENMKQVQERSVWFPEPLSLCSEVISRVAVSSQCSDN